jgi:DNA polymerase elongation subunit (family B)
VFVSGCTREEFADFVAWCNAELYPRLLRLLGCEPGLINLAYEKAFERIVFVQKKRYSGRYSHYKGTAATSESKPEVKGLEYKRGDSIRLARQLQEEAVDLLVGQEHGGNEDPEIFKRLLERWRERVLVQPLELADVVVVKGLNKPINSYAKRTKKDGMEARQLPHIEVAKILTERGREITEGSRIGYVIVDGSTNPQTVIPAEDWSGKVDRSAAWESLVAPPTIRVLEAAFPAIDWKPFEIVRTKEQKAKARKAARANQESAPVLFESGQYSRSKEKNDAEAD